MTEKNGDNFFPPIGSKCLRSGTDNGKNYDVRLFRTSQTYKGSSKQSVTCYEAIVFFEQHEI